MGQYLFNTEQSATRTACLQPVRCCHGEMNISLFVRRDERSLDSGAWKHQYFYRLNVWNNSIPLLFVRCYSIWHLHLSCTRAEWIECCLNDCDLRIKPVRAIQMSNENIWSCGITAPIEMLYCLFFCHVCSYISGI